MDVIKNEPVLIQSLVQAILGLFLAFGVSLSNEQVGSIMAVTAIVLAVLARIFVTPNNKVPPVDEPPVEPAV
jgi:hypothetical protein